MNESDQAQDELARFKDAGCEWSIERRRLEEVAECFELLYSVLTTEQIREEFPTADFQRIVKAHRIAEARPTLCVAKQSSVRHSTQTEGNNE